jgi:hypothetical protein
MKLKTMYSWGVWSILLLLLILKLSGAINISWLWVLAPLWIPISIVLGVLLVALFGVMLLGMGAFVLALFHKGAK